MPRKKILLRPGVNTQMTPSMNEAGVSRSNLVRVQMGQFQRMGGWQKLFSTACNSYVRAMHAWRDLDLIDGLILAGDNGVQLYANGNLADFGLVRRSTTLTAPWFESTGAGLNCLINDPSHGVSVGQSVEINVPVSGAPDGASWIQRTTGTTVDILGLASMGGVSYALGSGGIIFSSATGEEWTQIATLTGGNNARAIASSGSLLVVVGTDGYIYTSPNGTAWTNRSIVTSADFQGVAFANSLFIACGENILYTSPNGTAWTQRTLPVSATYYGAAWSGSVFCIVGTEGRIATSATGESWAAQSSGTTNALYGVTWSGSVLCAVGAGGTILTAPNAGVVWTPQSSGVTTTLRSVASSASVLYVVGAAPTGGAPTLLRGTTGGTGWSSRTLASGMSAAAVIFNGSRFIVGGSGGVIATTYALATNQVMRLNAAAFTVTSVVDPDHYTVDASAPATSAQGYGGYTPLHVVNYFGAPNRSTIRVHLNNHGLTVGSTYAMGVTVIFPLNGITLSGSYIVTAVVSTSVFEIASGQTASTTLYESIASGGNTVSLLYPVDAPTNPDSWSLDNLGQDALICPANGPIYVYQPPLPSSGTPVADVITTGPMVNTGMFVSMPQAQIIAFGSAQTLGSMVQDPLLLRWCSPGDFTDWVASTTNQAGSFRLSRGSRIVGGIQAPQASLLWTDIDCWSMQYIGGDLVYSFLTIGTGCGLISTKARVVQGRNTYWMSKKGFFQFGDSGVAPLSCSVWDVIFNDLDQANIEKIHAASNSAFSEIMFFYPSLSGGTGEIDAYVKYNAAEGVWDYGRLCRTAWIDQNVFGNALGADGSFHIQEHEIGYDDDGAPMAGAFIETGLAQIDDGTYALIVDEFQPDFVWMGQDGAANITVTSSVTPQGPTYASGPFSVTPDLLKMPLRARARYLSFKFEWAAKRGFNMRMGAPTIRGAPAGRQP